ncbi:hypothetical protein SARC_00815 [Sphaeroforma arctica JP610]|uniref:Pentafunctional AROM polypeptide n=1 Tax=Sphaeroforma arctica JP610 TaxID=667725 RepID=A0A0L0GDX7_9EUKA|nr:hypothetical protein SARC_00815 [Sphaeroforma arctica JP610]KNC87071.1 hypothetical protein SARC_00815 [Sphaeroforma arctica JP610]|eukprot:XP_014160973.1 hypothetical protein SARC_00815 [Sphaeroforma arctica JP610]
MANENMYGAKSISILGRKDIYVGQDLLPFIAKDVVQNVKAGKYVIVTDKNIEPLYLEKVVSEFAANGVELLSYIIPSGEASKCRSVKAEIEDWLLEQQCSRDLCLLALGGGVIGDLIGYVAATFMRGVKFVQIPTSLLAMVDSSIGGKTGIDTPHGKNLVGAFHQPARVYLNVSFLLTLPMRQICNGMGEVIKTAAIWSSDEFEYLEKRSDDILNLDLDALEHIVTQSASVKAEVVTADEKEGGLRGLLNFGHTIGHAIEALCQPEMLHGEAVAIGMMREVEVARALGILSQANVSRLARMLKLYRLPTVMPRHLTIPDLMKKMSVDKKNTNGVKRLVLIKTLGEVDGREPKCVDDLTLTRVLSEYVRVVPSDKANQINATVRVPGSKSISNRALLMTSLSEGQCDVSGLLHSDDTQVMVDALKSFGVGVSQLENGEVMRITGSGGKFTTADVEIYLGNAGTASRFLTTAVTLCPEGAITTLTGNARMKERPIGPLVDALRANGTPIEYLESEGCLPLKIPGGGLNGGLIELSAAVSSQYVSSILISAPYAKEQVCLSLVGDEVISQPYIDMTNQLLKQFGVDVEREDGTDIYNIHTTTPQNPAKFLVEGDASSATYPLAIAAITGGTVTVDNVGSDSLQGDANFCSVLESMGCTVKQTGSTTTVTGPVHGTHLKAVDVDMMTMTDAFMTAAVLCSVSSGTSRLTGIANQRVKECDRLAAMVTELGKLGVQARELEDGIEIDGNPDISTWTPASIHCYDDHRIAMSFGVLGCKVPGISISEKYCVEKTYPAFWDDLQTILGQTLEVPETCTHKSTAAHLSNASIILIGYRGAGKTTIGREAARATGRKFVDIDEHLETVLGTTLKEFIEEHGWAKFRTAEQTALTSILGDHAYSTDWVIACGGGIVETEKACKTLAAHPLVIHIDRDIDDICDYLLQDKTRPSFAQHPKEVYLERKSRYEQCRSYVFPILKGESNWPAVVQDFLRLMRTISSPSPLGKTTGHPSFFLSLTFGDVREAIAIGLDVLGSGVNALELRVDLLNSHAPEFVTEQVALLRRHSPLPIVYTVRSVTQGGAFSGSEEKLFSLLHLGVKLGCEYVDFETIWSGAVRENLLKNRQASALVASFHVAGDVTPWDTIQEEFIKAYHGGRVDVVKVVVRATELDDVYTLRSMLSKLPFSAEDTNIIALAMGKNGTLSRALNTFLTPVTHKALPLIAAPGQLCVDEIHTLRTLIGMLPARKFYLLGSPISKSPSPLIHNTAFAKLGLLSKYALHESDDIKVAVKVFEEAAFGGCSVTIPHKQDIMPYLSELSESAKAIGAVNTVIKTEDGKLLGDNTDWLGIKKSLSACAAAHSIAFPPKTALVLGAGGTARAACYTLRQMGVADVYIYNRSASKAVTLADQFGVTAVTELAAIPASIQCVVSTIPASAEITLPSEVLQSVSIVLDAAYLPRRTALLRQAADAGIATVEGVEMLLEQAFCQFELWNGIPCDTKAVRSALYVALDES